MSGSLPSIPLALGFADSRILTILAFVLLGGIIVAGLLTIYFLQREKAEESEPPATNEDLLKEFERARFAGEMDEEEFQRVTAVLQSKKTGKPAPAAPLTNATASEPRAAGESVEAKSESDPTPAPGEPEQSGRD